MEQAKMFFQKLLYPSKWVLIFLPPISFAALIFIFATQNKKKCAGIHHLLYVGVFSYDMFCGNSEADKKDKIRYNKQQNYEEGICVKNHGTVSE